MEDPRTLPPERRARRFGRAGFVVALIVLAIIVVIFVGQNLWHAQVSEREQDAAVASGAP